MNMQSSRTEQELLEEATKVIKKEGRASASSLQKSLNIGYARAVRLLDQLEENGVITQSIGSNMSDERLKDYIVEKFLNLKNVSAEKITKRLGLGYSRAVRIISLLKKQK